MFTLGLKKYIYPHNRLIEYCDKFINNIFNEYPIEITNNETFNFSFSRTLPKCTLKVNVQLKRQLLEKFVGTDIITVSCHVSNVISHDFFSYQCESKNINQIDFITHLRKSKTFRNWHHYENLIKSWNILFEKYSFSYRFIDLERYHRIYTPNSISAKVQLELLPGLIRYNYTGDVIRKKRFDMCLILRYDESKFVTEEMMNNCISIRPVSVILRFNNHNRDYKIFDENMWILNELQYVIIQNTNSCDNILFEDLELHDIKSCELTYKLEGKIFEYKIPIHTLKPIKEVWRIYNETNS